jgi:hypothetical protein
MQASKIKIGATYAIKHYDVLKRFRVTAVITRRVNDYGNPHDYESTVEGFFAEPGHSTEKQSLEPKEILGPFDEHQELVARRAAEKAVQEKEAEEKKQLAEALVKLFYKKTGLERPTGKYTSGPFSARYGYGVEIGETGVAALLKVLT